MGEKRFLRLTEISLYYTKEAIERQIRKGIQSRISLTIDPSAAYGSADSTKFINHIKCFLGMGQP